jgi:hypothetical protein
VVTHLPYPHVPELGYSERQCLIGLDAPRALLHVEKCPCGADTLHPYEDSLIALMEAEYGIKETPDERIRKRVLSLTYDPVVEAVGS